MSTHLVWNCPLCLLVGFSRLAKTPTTNDVEISVAGVKVKAEILCRVLSQTQAVQA
jgi:hypothetical protein